MCLVNEKKKKKNFLFSFLKFYSSNLPMFVPIGDVWRSVFIGYERTSNDICIRYDTRATKMIPDRFVYH